MEEKILELLFARSESALNALEAQYGPGLQRLARQILRDPGRAEEAVSDTYLAIWNTIPPERPKPLAAFVYRVCRNIALKRRRYESAQKRSGLEISLEELSDCIGGPSLEEIVSARELARALDRWLGKQTRDNRVIFLRRYWFGDSIPQIAALTGLKENVVSVRLNRLRTKLKDHLIREGLYEREME